MFVEPIINRVSRITKKAKEFVDAGVEAEFNNSAFFAEGFLRCRYKIETVQKPLSSLLDGSFNDEPSDEELL